MPYWILPQGSVDTGMCFRMFIATGLNSAGLIVLLTNPAAGDRVIGLALQLGPVIWVKSPASIAAVGAKLVLVGGLLFSIRPWYPSKKNRRSLTIGPPSVPPNWLRFRLSRAGARTLRALKW